ASWHANRKCRLDLIKGDLRLGAEDDILRDTCLGPSLGIVRPGLRQIEPICYRQAGVIVGHRQAHRDLAIILLTQLSAVLPRNADRMLALLREAGVADDPGADRSLPRDRR